MNCFRLHLQNKCALRVKWKFPEKPNGNVTHFVITWHHMTPEVDFSSFDTCRMEEESLVQGSKTGTTAAPVEVMAKCTCFVLLIARPTLSIIYGPIYSVNTMALSLGVIVSDGKTPYSTLMPTTSSGHTSCNCPISCGSSVKEKAAMQKKRSEHISFHDQIINDMFEAKPMDKRGSRPSKSFHLWFNSSDI